MENIYEDAMSILNDNIEINKKQLKKKLKDIYKRNELSDEEIDLINKAFNDFNKATLKYNKSRGYTIIKEISPLLKELIDEKKLDFDDKRNIVLLTKHNAEIIEKTIKNDDNYYSFFKRIFKSFSLSDIKNDNDKALFACVREIDRDNFTNVWRYKSNRPSIYKTVEYMSKPENNFWDKLASGIITLPDELVEVGGTAIKSLSSKICKYLSEEISSNPNNKFNTDCYYINDSYIRAVLLFYLDYYEIEHTKIKSINAVNNLTYEKLFELLEKLNVKANKKHGGKKLTKNELDHILWYCYKSFKIS